MTDTHSIRTAVETDPTAATFRARLGTAFAMFRNAKSVTGLAILGFFVLVAIFADVLARTIVAPAELPIGIITAAVGGPFFLWILLRQRSRLAL